MPATRSEGLHEVDHRDQVGAWQDRDQPRVTGQPVDQGTGRGRGGLVRDIDHDERGLDLVGAKRVNGRVRVDCPTRGAQRHRELPAKRLVRGHGDDPTSQHPGQA
ncbi:MAG: hypothetical protein WKG01_40370 [Kofleriaceae bacterium]